MSIRPVTALVAAAVILASAIVVSSRVYDRRLIPVRPLELVVRSRRFSASTITLEGVQALSTLATVRYVHRAVFPYDYLPPDVALDGVVRKLRNSQATVSDTLTPDESLYVRAHTLATDVGLSAAGGTFDFVVVSLVITAGYDLVRAMRALELVDVHPAAAARRAVVTLDAPTIMEIAVEDIRPAQYPYPDVSLSPDGWRRVAAFVRDELVPQPVLDELLRAAGRNGEAFVRGVLAQAGITDVQLIRND